MLVLFYLFVCIVVGVIAAGVAVVLAQCWLLFIYVVVRFIGALLGIKYIDPNFPK